MALGIVLTSYGQNPDGTSPPFTVNYASVNRHNNLCPPDPQFNTRGEQGMYYDTPLGGFGQSKLGRKIARWKINHTRRLMGLGDIPTDAELARVRGYTPVQSGWINTADHRFVTGPWIPPNGQDYSGTPAPIALHGLRGLRDDAAAALPLAPTDQLIATMNAHNDRIFALTLVSTAAVAVSAMITIFRTLKLISKE